MRPVVLGAAGFLGLNLVDALLAEGVEPRCGRRKRTNVLALRQRKVPMVHADLDDVAQLEAAFHHADVVFHLAGHYPRLSLDPDGATRTGLTQLNHVLDAAAKAGVRRVVYVSSTATVAPTVDGRPSTEGNVFEDAPGFGTYHALKWHMEARALREERLEVVVACPSACLGPWDLRVGTSALLVATARGLDVPHPDGVVSWVDARDVALGLLRLGQHPSPARRVILSAGGTRLQELLESLSRRYGVAPPSRPLPAAQALAFCDAEERRAQAEGGRPALARELADLIIHGVPLDAALARRTLGLSFRPLSTTLDAFDDWARRVRILPSSPQQEPRP